MMTNAGCFSLFLDKIRDLLRCFWRETEPYFIDHNFYRGLNKKFWQKQSIPMQRFSPFKVFDCYAYNTFAELIYSVENSIGKKLGRLMTETTHLSTPWTLSELTK